MLFAGFCCLHAMADEPIYYSVTGPGGQSFLRWVTSSSDCPTVQWRTSSVASNQAGSKLDLRVLPGQLPARSSAAGADSKPAVFDSRVCEAAWPEQAVSAWVDSKIEIKAPVKQPKRIVVLGDTGCRMKASENAFQDCNNPDAWPFAKIADRAAAMKPDLVLHLGDLHYRESPCPSGMAGCANSPWGYGEDAWRADFFEPAKHLLKTAAWLFVRGNHEICSRAGLGWFRFVEPRHWNDQSSCNLAVNDSTADFTAPFAVPVGSRGQIIVFDSSRTAGKPLAADEPMFKTYQRQINEIALMAKAVPGSMLVNHHPVMAVAASSTESRIKSAGNAALKSVFSNEYPGRMLPENIIISLHGHVHLFEWMRFKNGYPDTAVLGNSGSANEGHLIEKLPANTVLDGLELKEYQGSADYGFALLEEDDLKPGTWHLKEFDLNGKQVFSTSFTQP